jgi:hypothetical protein
VARRGKKAAEAKVSVAVMCGRAWEEMACDAPVKIPSTRVVRPEAKDDAPSTHGNGIAAWRIDEVFRAAQAPDDIELEAKRVRGQ